MRKENELERTPIKTIILSEDDDVKEVVEVYSDYIRMVDYDRDQQFGQWWESFSHCIPIETLRKIMSELD